MTEMLQLLSASSQAGDKPVRPHPTGCNCIACVGRRGKEVREAQQKLSSGDGDGAALDANAPAAADQGDDSKAAAAVPGSAAERLQLQQTLAAASAAAAAPAAAAAAAAAEIAAAAAAGVVLTGGTGRNANKGQVRLTIRCPSEEKLCLAGLFLMRAIDMYTEAASCCGLGCGDRTGVDLTRFPANMCRQVLGICCEV